MLLEISMWIWLPLFLAIILAFVQQTKASFILLGMSIIGGLLEGRLGIYGLTALICGFAIAYKTPTLAPKWQIVAYTWMTIWCAALALHIIPGFTNAKVLDAVNTGIQSVPFTMYLNFDKPMLFFGLVLAYPAVMGNMHIFNKKKVLIASLFLFSLLPIAWWLGELKFEISVPHWWWLFVLNNLLLTCVAEEAFFRGFLQQLFSKRFGLLIGIAITSLLFGFAHLGGGFVLVCFSALAGICYGLIYHYSSRLWVAVLFHFLFNFCHLLLFTYPLAK